MKSELHTTKSFRKDYKKLSKSEIADTDVVIKKLLNNENLDVSYNDHDLHGNYDGYKECHVRPDLLLEVVFQLLYRLRATILHCLYN